MTQMTLEKVIKNTELSIDMQKFLGSMENLDYNDPVYRVLKLNMRNPCSRHTRPITEMVKEAHPRFQ